MWTVSKTEVAGLLRLNLLARLQEAREREAIFERTYRQSFSEFEESVLGDAEEFTRWDDYVEWKAYRKLRQELSRKIEALKRGDFTVA